MLLEVLALSLAVVVAYGMYKECASKTLAHAAFGINPDEIDVLSFHDFRDRLSAQGLSYSPVHRRYPGDSAMRAVTRQTTAQQQKSIQKRARQKKARSPQE